MADHHNSLGALSELCMPWLRLLLDSSSSIHIDCSTRLSYFPITFSQSHFVVCFICVVHCSLSPCFSFGWLTSARLQLATEERLFGYILLCPSFAGDCAGCLAVLSRPKWKVLPSSGFGFLDFLFFYLGRYVLIKSTAVLYTPTDKY